MQTLVIEIANTFVDDAAAFMKGCGRIAVGILMAPIERMATACDVGNVLQRKRPKYARSGSPPSRSPRRRWRPSLDIFSFRDLANLT